MASTLQYNTATRSVKTCQSSCCGQYSYECGSGACVRWECWYVNESVMFSRIQKFFNYQCPGVLNAGGPANQVKYLSHSECVARDSKTCYANRTCPTSCCGYKDWVWTGWGYGYWCSSNTCKYQTRTVYY